LRFVTDEAETALAFLSAEARGEAPCVERAPSRGIPHVKRPEESVHAPFTDDQFRAFVADPATLASRTELARTLTEPLAPGWEPCSRARAWPCLGAGRLWLRSERRSAASREKWRVCVKPSNAVIALFPRSISASPPPATCAAATGR
jgi:hypothetical protein